MPILSTNAESCGEWRGSHAAAARFEAQQPGNLSVAHCSISIRTLPNHSLSFPHRTPHHPIIGYCKMIRRSLTNRKSSVPELRSVNDQTASPHQETATARIGQGACTGPAPLSWGIKIASLTEMLWTRPAHVAAQ
jgi:hypothetical protein